MNPPGMAAASQPVLELRDVHLPPAPGWWPPAPGWWIAAALLLALLLPRGIWLAKRLRERRRRKRIFARLSELGKTCTPEKTADFLAGVSVLLRQVAVERYPREKVASLSGEEWVRFLDETGGNGRFRDEIGETLGEGPYRPQAEADVGKVLELARAWIGKNL